MDKQVKMFFKYASSLEFEEYIEACVKNISYIFNHFDTHTHTHKCTHMHISAYTYMCPNAYACATVNTTQMHMHVHMHIYIHTHKFSHMRGILSIVTLTVL